MEHGIGKMTKKNIKKIILDFDKTFPYFKDHIGCGKTLSKKIIEKIDFSQGLFFTLLPENANLNKLYEFSHGEIIPQSSNSEEPFFIEGISQPFHLLLTTDHDLCEFIKFFLNKQNKNYAILESVVSEIDDPNINIKNVKLISYNKEIYYFLNKKNSIEEINETVKTTVEFWHFLSVLTTSETKILTPLDNQELDKKPSYPLTNKDFDKICDHIKFVIAGAYDGEGYIFWEKKEQNNN